MGQKGSKISSKASSDSTADENATRPAPNPEQASDPEPKTTQNSKSNESKPQKHNKAEESNILGTPSDILNLVSSLVGDKVIFQASLCSKALFEILKPYRQSRDDYISEATFLHPSIFSSDSCSSNHKLILIKQAKQNIKSGRVTIVRLTAHPDEGDQPHRWVETMQVLQDGGNHILMECGLHYPPLEDGEEEQMPSCCHIDVNISAYPQLSISSIYSTNDFQKHLVSSDNYLSWRKYDYRPNQFHLGSFGSQELMQAPIDALSSIIPESTPFGFHEMLLFSQSASSPLLAVNYAKQQAVRACHLLSGQLLDQYLPVKTQMEVSALCGPWLLSNSEGLLFNFNTGEQIRLKKSHNTWYMLDRTRLVSFSASSGKIRQAELTDRRGGATILKQLSASSATLPFKRGRLWCLSGRVGIIATIGSGSTGCTQHLAFVDLDNERPSILGILHYTSSLDAIEDVKPIDCSLFAVRRSRNVDLIDLLNRDIIISGTEKENVSSQILNGKTTESASSDKRETVTASYSWSAS